MKRPLRTLVTWCLLVPAATSAAVPAPAATRGSLKVAVASVRSQRFAVACAQACVGGGFETIGCSSGIQLNSSDATQIRCEVRVTVQVAGRLKLGTTWASGRRVPLNVRIDDPGTCRPGPIERCDVQAGYVAGFGSISVPFHGYCWDDPIEYCDAHSQTKVVTVTTRRDGTFSATLGTFTWSSRGSGAVCRRLGLVFRASYGTLRALVPQSRTVCA